MLCIARYRGLLFIHSNLQSIVPLYSPAEQTLQQPLGPAALSAGVCQGDPSQTVPLPESNALRRFWLFSP